MDNKRGKGTFIRLIQFCKPYKIEFFVITFIIIFLIFSEIANGWFFKEFFDNITDKNFKATIYVFIIGVVINVLMSLCYYLRLRLVNNLAEKVGCDLKRNLFNHIVKLPVEIINGIHSGDLVSRVNNDVNEARNGISLNLVPLVYGPLLSFSVLIYMFCVNWKLATICTVISPITFFTGKVISKPIKENSKRVQETASDIGMFMQETVGGIVEIKSYNIEENIIIRFKNIINNNLNYGLKNNKLKSLMYGISNFIGFFNYAVIWSVGGYLAITGQMSAGELLVFTRLLDRVMNPFSTFMTSWVNFKYSLVAADRIFEILDLPEEKNLCSLEEVNTYENNILIQKLTFGYSKDAYVIKGLDMKVNNSMRVGIVGESGCGKSTLLKLILGLYEAESGIIKINDRLVNDLNRRELSRLIAYIPQNGFLFNGTIKENILVGRENASNEEIIEAAKIAHAHNFICNLKKGYDTNIGENAGKLSGGEKQRIVLARAILKNSPIMIMDEATSALDAETEKNIIKSIKTNLKEKTIIIVSHRLLTLTDCDTIFVMKDGQVIDYGEHYDLLKESSYYKELFNSQF